MRTKQEAEELVEKHAPIILGQPLPDFFAVGLSDDAFGGTNAAPFQDKSGKINFAGIDIAPRRYWEDFPTNDLVALLAQEKAAAELVEMMPTLASELAEKLMVTESIEVKRQLRTEYELGKGLLIAELNWKFMVDISATNRLVECDYPVQGYLNLLRAEIEEEHQTQPMVRSISRVWRARVRLHHIYLHLTALPENVGHASTLRAHIQSLTNQILFRTFETTPSPV